MKPRREWKPLKRSPLKRRGKPVPKINKAKQARKLAAYSAFMKSPEWRVIREAALVRAGCRCEAVTYRGFITDVRCTETTRLQVHHVRYGWRFGGNELPSDLKVLCKQHHDELHALKGVSPLWKRGAA